MTVTISPEGNTIVGPYTPFNIGSDFVGPLAVGSGWRMVITGPVGASSENPAWEVFIRSQNPFIVIKPFDLTISQVAIPTTNTPGQVIYPYKPATGTNMHVVVSLEDQFRNQLDQTSQAITWDASAGVPAMLADQQKLQNFSTADSSTLTDIQSSLKPTITTSTGAQQVSLADLFSGHTIDALTLTEISPGPTGAPVTSAVAGWFFGVIVRITSLPSWLQPTTPDGAWFYPDLAVLRVFRGTDLENRYPIHTPSFMKPMPWQYGDLVLNETLLFGVPPAVSVEVDWAPGVEGQVFLMKFP